jgi:hypothetical protein
MTSEKAEKTVKLGKMARLALHQTPVEGKIAAIYVRVALTGQAFLQTGAKK